MRTKIIALSAVVLFEVALQLCGGIFYIQGGPVAYCLGEEIALGKSFVIHFEKAVLNDEFKGIFQFINQAFRPSPPIRCSNSSPACCAERLSLPHLAGLAWIANHGVH